MKGFTPFVKRNYFNIGPFKNGTFYKDKNAITRNEKYRYSGEESIY